MSWNGSNIKTRSKELGLKLIKVAEKLEVSRQTVNKWIGGQVPRGHHLLGLCRILDTKPEYFFSSMIESLITVPQHRTVRKKKVTPEMKEASFELSEQYLNLFRQAPSQIIIPVVRIKERNEENAKKLARHLRDISSIPSCDPVSYEHAFKLLEKLGIYTIFRVFPDPISKKHIYAFYSKICEQRVVFVNTNTNVLDLIFQILHEAVHAIQDEETKSIHDEYEETFCDLVADFTQFPDEYVKHVARYIQGGSPGAIINKLKEMSAEYGHSLYGIYKRLNRHGLCPDLKVGGADTNLKKKFSTIEEILFKDENPRYYVDIIRELSPLFINLISEQIPNCSIRKFAEWLGLSTSIDAKAVMEEMERVKE